MNPLAHTRDQETVETVDFTRRVLRRRRRLSYQPERWWPPFSGIHKVWSTLTTWRRTKRSQGSTMPNYWADSTPNCKKQTAPFGEENSALPPWQRTSSHLRHRQGKLHYKLLPYPPYLTLCDFFLFPNLKKSLARQKFESSEEVIAATEIYFADLEKTYFSSWLKKSNLVKILTVAN